ncbi:nicotinamide/nicotinic acid mononucleotide adenylyltransferase 3 isoform X1 [Microplitis mediator]|uniref:nicotinamide/nicotinic acid mononucleotide adenylyltransferase 3 isoform X1 n=1 Tax=Microplitis mediator TaxID=375433 RepID=UPI00255391DD|nr:nicotinamide/nicotinic acid mononucleotide adenylyltransferase 3 isoform X1 [Microplitis mediator]
MTPTRVILMSCGSYNPPTNMHLRMFEIARDHLHRMGTHIVVGGVMSPVHDSYGKKDLVVAEHRCEMLRLALKSSDWIRVSTWETRENCWTRTRASLKHHQNLLNSVLQDSDGSIKNHIDSQDLEWIPENIRNGQDRSPIKIKLLCGADLLESFGKPGLWADEDIDAIVGQHGLVVITREGSNPNKFIYDSDLLSKYMHNIHIVTEWINNEVSSTKLRRALKRGESIKYLTQDPVIDYIYNWGLYDVVTTTIKLTLSTTDSNNYLHIDDKYGGAFLTPSPSDVTMASPSPVEIISIDLTESVIKKNIINSPAKQLTSVNSNDTECMREKFINIITENGNNKVNNSNGGTATGAGAVKFSYPGLAKQIITTETGESQLFREGATRPACLL